MKRQFGAFSTSTCRAATARGRCKERVKTCAQQLGHLLVVLRAHGVVAEPTPATTPVDEELRRFDEHMRHVRGLAPKTRSACLRTVRRLLIEQFADQPVVLSSIKPEDLRSFVARQSELYSTPASLATLAGALRQRDISSPRIATNA
jgi:hypothetical protein